MSFSKVVIVCCALMAAHVVSAEAISTVDGRVVVQHNPPDDLVGRIGSSVPPDPYRTVLHNPPGDKTLINDTSVPPDPYLGSTQNSPVCKNIQIDILHNPPTCK